MSLRFHEIAEHNHAILNPFTEDQLMLLGDICQLRSGLRQLDLCCGKAEMLCRWAQRYQIEGTGVDISKVFLAAAQRRAEELGVATRVQLVEADAGKYPISPGVFDVMSCIGATWIGDGLVGTLELMKPGLKDRDSLLLVGEPFWIEEPPDAAVQAMAGGDRNVFTSLAGTLERMENAGLELVEMVLAEHHGWDRYESMHWMAVSNWLRANPDDPRADELRQWNAKARREYLMYGRRYLGWGVFVLRLP